VEKITEFFRKIGQMISWALLLIVSVTTFLLNRTKSLCSLCWSKSKKSRSFIWRKVCLAWSYAYRNAKQRLAVVAILTAFVVCGVVLLILHGGEAKTSSNGESSILPFVIISLMAVAIGFWVYKARNQNSSESTNDETVPRTTTLGIKTEWIDNARGPAGVLLLYSIIIGIAHLICWFAWTDTWDFWRSQAGLFWSFNLFLVLAIFWGFQRFAGAKLVSAIFVAFTFVALVSALPEREVKEESSASIVSTYVEAEVGTWEELPSMMAPVGQFVPVPTPQGEEIRNEPQGAVWILPPGRDKKAFLYHPGDPWPHLGVIYGPISYMSAESADIEIRRWVKR